MVDRWNVVPGNVKEVGDRIDDEIDQFTADGAYDGYPTYDAVFRHSPGARGVIPPCSKAVKRPNIQASCQRDDHVASYRYMVG